MALTRGSNLSDVKPYPSQGVWLSHASRLSSDRVDWSPPQLVVDPDNDTDGWVRNGMCSPSIQWGNTEADRNVLYVFFVATTAKVQWFKESSQRLLHGKRPLIPAPFYFTIGRVAVTLKDRTVAA
jgi:hypothetical protein